MAEAAACTASRHKVLDYIGGIMSPEMQLPKLMWLKSQMPATWAASGNFFDLADFMTWKASGRPARSQCTLTAKWTYLAHDRGWQPDFLEAIGLGDLLERGSLPMRATPVAQAVGRLTSLAADELGLTTECVVATGLIDAFAGMLAVAGGLDDDEIEGHAGLIAGTSSCVMAFSKEPLFVPSIWGPCLGGALPGVWVAEGGQSATGALLDHIIRSHAKGGEPTAQRHGEIIARAQQLRTVDSAFGADVHVLPDFHGNRSPLGVPQASGLISGLTVDSSFDGLCKLYWRTCVAIALGVRHIVEHMNAEGYHIKQVHVAGGHVRNPLLMELYADAIGVTVVESKAADAMLLGSAMNAAVAAGFYNDIGAACRAMRQRQRMLEANPARRYDRDYAIFLALQRQQQEIARIDREWAVGQQAIGEE